MKTLMSQIGVEVFGNTLHKSITFLSVIKTMDLHQFASYLTSVFSYDRFIWGFGTKI